MSTAILVLVLVASAALLAGNVGAVIIRVPSGKVKCITEELHPGAISVTEFRIVGEPPHPFNISAKVVNPKAAVEHVAENVTAGMFAYTAYVPGQYNTCFWSPVFQKGTDIGLDVEWRTGMAAKNWNAVTKKEKIDEVEIELKTLESSISSIYEEMKLLREMEEEGWKLNEDTSSNMSMLSLLSLAICMSVAGLQLWHLKTFFEREKIL